MNDSTCISYLNEYILTEPKDNSRPIYNSPLKGNLNKHPNSESKINGLSHSAINPYQLQSSNSIFNNFLKGTSLDQFQQQNQAQNLKYLMQNNEESFYVSSIDQNEQVSNIIWNESSPSMSIDNKNNTLVYNENINVLNFSKNSNDGNKFLSVAGMAYTAPDEQHNYSINYNKRNCDEFQFDNQILNNNCLIPNNNTYESTPSSQNSPDITNIDDQSIRSIKDLYSIDNSKVKSKILNQSESLNFQANEIENKDYFVNNLLNNNSSNCMIHKSNNYNKKFDLNEILLGNFNLNSSNEAISDFIKTDENNVNNSINEQTYMTNHFGGLLENGIVGDLPQNAYSSANYMDIIEYQATSNKKICQKESPKIECRANLQNYNNYSNFDSNKGYYEPENFVRRFTVNNGIEFLKPQEKILNIPGVTISPLEKPRRMSVPELDSNNSTKARFPVKSDINDTENTKPSSLALTKPRRQKLRFQNDLYTPLWVRNSGQAKEGFCDTCKPGKWLQLKNSAYWYHKQFYHGISSVSGKPFIKPLQIVQIDADTYEGLCHQCLKWVTIATSKRKNSVLWYRHAHKCHIYHKPKTDKLLKNKLSGNIEEIDTEDKYSIQNDAIDIENSSFKFNENNDLNINDGTKKTFQSILLDDSHEGSIKSSGENTISMDLAYEQLDKNDYTNIHQICNNFN
ncbi:hypothetical protein BB561_004708 [Smittium simulii]|uniref:Transcription regulator Rua1 C-terminal domain-containing protein n=1 Tax=Smittium simulii TaxID=133385 RepID=A0A2T9YEN8_9FUNG|nr:hypothetical protein BB561_004708 [Smittium simulii]